MSSNVFKQFEEQFGHEWKCSCGSEFESDWVEVVSKTKNTLLARYSCQICGREQIFAISADLEQDFIDVPIMDLPSRAVNSDDVLDIRAEIKKLRFNQVRTLGKKRNKISATRTPRK